MGWKFCVALIGALLCLPLITLHADEADSSDKEIVLNLFHPSPARWQSISMNLAPRHCEPGAKLEMELTDDRGRFTTFALTTGDIRIAIPVEQLQDYLYPELEYALILAWCSGAMPGLEKGYLIQVEYSLRDEEMLYERESAVLSVLFDATGEFEISADEKADMFFERYPGLRYQKLARWQAASIGITPRGCERDIRLDVGLTPDRRRFTGLSFTTVSGHFTADIDELWQFSYPNLEEMILTAWCDDPEDEREEGYALDIDYSLSREEYSMAEFTSELYVTFNRSGRIKVEDGNDRFRDEDEERD